MFIGIMTVANVVDSNSSGRGGRIWEFGSGKGSQGWNFGSSHCLEMSATFLFQQRFPSKWRTIQLSLPGLREWKRSLSASPISFVKKGSNAPAAKSHLRETAIKDGIDFVESGDKGMISYFKRSKQAGVPLLVSFWEIGEKNTVAIVSATVVEAQSRTKAVAAVLKIMPQILESIAITTTYKIIEADGEKVEATVTTVDPTPQGIRPFKEKEVNWLQTNLEAAVQLGIKYGSGGRLTPKELDLVFARWTDDDEEREEGDAVANALGAAFGEFLVEDQGFCWVVFSDQNGTEYAVRHRLGENTAFPRASVRKRIEAGETGFFHGIYLVLLDRLQECEAEDGKRTAASE